MRDGRSPASERRVHWATASLVMAAAGGLTMGFGRLTFAFLLEDMRHDFVDTYTVAGVIGAANLLGYMVGVFLTNVWLRTVSPTTLAVRGAALGIVGLLAVPLLGTTVTTIGAMLLLGFGGGLVWISSVPIVSVTAPEKRRGIAFGVMLSGIGTSIAVTGLVVRGCNELFGAGSWREVWLVEAALGIVVLICLIVILPPMPSPVLPDVAAGKVRGLPPGIVGAVICYFLFGVSHSLYSNFLVAAAQEGQHMSATYAASVYAVLGLTNIAGGVLLGRASDAAGRRRLLVAAALLMAVCAAVVPMHIDTLTTASGATYGLLMSGFPTILIAALSDRFTGPQLAAAYTAVTLAVGAGQLLGPPVGGLLADHSGSFTSTFVLGAVAATAAAVAAIFIPDRPRARPASDMIDPQAP